MASTTSNHRVQPLRRPPTQSVPPLSPTNTLVGPDPANIPPHPPPTPECLHLAVDDEHVPVGIVPCHEHPGMIRRTVFGLKLTTLREQKGNDLFNYEDKYPADEPYKELDDASRFWKTCVDEATKVDAGQVVNWTDALDVLLVFAGLFSAVVSTFVCQTFQNLQVDPTEVMSSLIFELLAVTRAIDEHGPGSSKGVARADTTFHPTKTATWVNGLWYVSLTLSLTTALIAALIKQWIHQYMNYAQLGTPRARARVRHFRFMQLQAWHVPAIIGLLPVMMHTALGLFLAGLTIQIRPLNTPMCFVVGGLVVSTLLAYISTNLLPVYSPACPYKTPLSDYAYLAARRLRTCGSSTIVSILKILYHKSKTFLGMAPVVLPPSGPSEEDTAPVSLIDAEAELVRTASDVLDAQVVTWAYSVSSNPSVQSIVLQTLGSLPLHVVQIVKDHIGSKVLEDAAKNAVRSPLLLAPDRQPAFERLLRSFVHFFPETTLASYEIQPECRCEDSLARLLNIDNSLTASEFLKAEIMQPSRRYDAAVWAQIMSNAFRWGPNWLEAEVEGSALWQTFTGWFIEPHTGSLSVDRVDPPEELYSLLAYGGIRLTVVNHSDPETPPNEPMYFRAAAVGFMRPSLCKLLLDIGYRSWSKPLGIPSDIQLRLALVQTEWMLKTSRSLGDEVYSPLTSLIRSIRRSVGIDAYDGAINHDGVMRATYYAMKSVISNAFPTDVLSRCDQQKLLHILFRSLVADRSLTADYLCWMTEPIADRILHVVFLESAGRLSEVLPIMADLLESAVRAECPVLLPRLCSQLCRAEWLTVTRILLFDSTHSSRGVPIHKRLYSLMAAAFVDALHILKNNSRFEYDEVLAYTEQAPNFLSLCQILLLSDADRQHKLWGLVSIVSPSLWSSCFRDLRNFILTPYARDAYSHLAAFPLHPYRDGRALTYTSFGEMSALLNNFIVHVRRHPHNCNCYQQMHVESTPRDPRWWRQFVLPALAQAAQVGRPIV